MIISASIYLQISDRFLPHILQSDDDGEDNIKNENNNEKILTKKQIIDIKNYKKLPFNKKSEINLHLKNENILDDKITINDNNSPVNNKPQSLSELLRNKDIRFLSLLYTFFCFSVMFVDEVFPLWAVRYTHICIYV
jgi:hypothetical protein